VSGDETALADYRRQAPHAVLAHPGEEHVMPLFVAMGAGGETAHRLHSSATFGSLRMDVYSFS
jgi:4,5-DOPA dioxygenase extradiol